MKLQSTDYVTIRLQDYRLPMLCSSFNFSEDHFPCLSTYRHFNQTLRSSLKENLRNNDNCVKKFLPFIHIYFSLALIILKSTTLACFSVPGGEGKGREEGQTIANHSLLHFYLTVFPWTLSTSPLPQSTSIVCFP